MIFKPYIIFNQNITDFTGAVEFFNILNLENDAFYEIEFYFIINYENCPVNSVRLKISLTDDEYFSEALFESNNTDASTVENNKWNKFTQCFQVMGREYKLNIQGESACENVNVFIVVDGIRLRKLNEVEKSRRECLNLQQTLKPETKTSLGTTKTSLETTKTSLFTSTKEEQSKNSTKETPDNSKVFEFLFDELEDDSYFSFEDFGSIINVRSLSFPQKINYKPNGNDALLLTDVTSISKNF